MFFPALQIRHQLIGPQVGIDPICAATLVTGRVLIRLKANAQARLSKDQSCKNMPEFVIAFAKTSLLT
jgi:hypothetical protein